MTLMHCFGTDKTFPVNTQLAIEMLAASGINEITLNTHNIDQVNDWENLSVGYGDATWSSISKIINTDHYQPIFNINLPENVNEAILRTEKALKFSKTFPIKLEVLNKEHDIPNNNDVVDAAKFLKSKYPNLKVWPLITPNLIDYNLLKEIGCEMIRVLGSSIGSSKGISIETQEFIKAIVPIKERPIIVIDGGIGNISDVELALKLKVDRVLVNSFLFKGNDAVSMLSKIKTIVN